MPDKNPPAGKPGDFFVRKTACGRYACKNEHLGQGRQRTAFRSRFLYFRITPGSPASFLRRTHAGKHACKSEHTGRRRRRTNFRSRFLYLHIPPGSPARGFLCGECTCWQPRPQKANTSNSAGGCSPHFSDSRIVFGSRRPGGFLRAVRARQPDLDGGGHFRRDGLSPGRSPLWQRRGHSAETASVRWDFCIEKGQARKPVLF